MPVLDTAEKLERIVLPSYANRPEDQQIWVVMDVAPLVAQDILHVDKETGAMQFGLEIVTRRTREWNVTDPEGNPVPVSREVIERFRNSDLEFLAQQIDLGSEGLETEEKKA